jgi:hypothetical protein
MIMAFNLLLWCVLLLLHCRQGCAAPSACKAPQQEAGWLHQCCCSSRPGLLLLC